MGFVLIDTIEYKELVTKANKYDELRMKEVEAQEKDSKANKESAIEEKTEIKIKKVSAEEMAQLVDDLINKILGGK